MRQNGKKSRSRGEDELLCLVSLFPLPLFFLRLFHITNLHNTLSRFLPSISINHNGYPSYVSFLIQKRKRKRQRETSERQQQQHDRFYRALELLFLSLLPSSPFPLCCSLFFRCFRRRRVRASMPQGRENAK